ncbi:SAG family member (sag23) [Eimeria tenella]|uniref:SAG family member (Sag23) n=1 Tax=Eimeria tenella TaxID=5802 RepID=Q70CC7_EIMTE|nr:SAG family member (sag23) [Eimeria tenella]CAE52308.1 surface antigen 23 [Eimeria tenella]CDJ43251.1 SAG family member (sag23) [Eimeria tenella]|eukprot:XP_013234001.1 SAG family member (sag23) [Eimeria tenella]
MIHVGLLACYAGLLASTAAPHFSSALSLRSGTATSQQNSLRTNLFATGQDLLRTTTAPVAEEKTNDCLAIINKLRNENLKDLLGTLTKATDGEVTASLTKIGQKDAESLTAAKIAAKLAGENVDTCDSGKNADAKTYPGLVIPFAPSTQFDCNALIQATYTAGLNHLKQSNFGPSTGTYDPAKAPFDKVEASNVAFLLSAKSTKVSCGATKDCKAGHNVLFCYFVEPLRTGEMPFTTELYNALWGLGSAAFVSFPSVATVLLVLALSIRI